MSERSLLRLQSDSQRSTSLNPQQRPILMNREQSKLNPVVQDEMYGRLNDDNRVVMRHQIALNLDQFRASTDDFEHRPDRSYADLQPTTTPFMSVIIPNHNGQRFLPPLFDALAQQTFCDFEIILVDDASTDQSVAWLEENWQKENHPDLRIIVNRRNLGFVTSVNTGADTARGRIIVLLNSDTEPEPNWLAELAKTICEQPQAAIVASKILLHTERDTLHTAGDLMGSDGIPRNRGVWEKDNGQYDAETSIFSGSGCGMAVHKAVWHSLGGFDEDFWMYLEDVDLAFRAQLSGWQAVFAPRARIYHRLSATSGDTLASYYVGRNTIWTIAKNMPTSLLMRNFFKILMGQLAIMLDAVRNIQGEAARARLRGQLDGLLGLPRQIAKRQTIQVRRRVADPEFEKRLT